MEPLLLGDGWMLHEIEASMRRIHENRGAPLQVSKDFVGRRKGALHDAARLQLLATWARAAEVRELYYHAANILESTLQELCNYAPGLTVLRLCNGVNVGDVHVSRRKALEYAIEKMQATDELRWEKIIKGRTIDFTCISGSKVQYLRPFFSSRNSDEVRRKEGMFLILSDLRSFVTRNDADLIPRSFMEACAVFVYELFKNTQQHATSDYKKAPYLEHVEGLIISWKQLSRDEYDSDFNGHPLLQDFWERECVVSSPGGKRELRCLQLSFFDTGPGFSSRATGKSIEQLSIEEERKALIDCLHKNFSTKKEVGSGNGLPGVLEELRKVGGLISIRTGRLNVFNAFGLLDSRDIFDFHDWSPNELAAATGAVVSLTIPIRR